MMKLHVDLGKRGYDVIVKRGALGHAGKLCSLNRRVLVITDDGVPLQYAETIMKQCKEPYLMVLPQGEATKSIESWQKVLQKLMQLQFDRTDVVAAVGGGVIGDLAGFVAACYMRGITFFQFPTTTLSQIDSSIGGKVAVNLLHTKNIVGNFYQPALVVVDTDTLPTLSERHRINGLAEALKTGLIGDAEIFDIFENGDFNQEIENIIYRCLLYKKGVVERDETEQGERKLLNFGHTIGHGIEAVYGLEAATEPLFHGECVGLGMLPMIENKNLRERTAKIMKKMGLPTKLVFDPEKIYKGILSDKKRNKDSITVVKVRKAGEAYLEDISLAKLRTMLEEKL